ncbi:MAG: glycoside hydrolase family 2 TIM barrel-domain containing protein [Acidobacteriota bacterium]
MAVISPSIARASSHALKHAETCKLLEQGWEFFRGTLGGPWEAWNLHGAEWKPVQLPHCFNAHDACDPDHEAYRGQGWYRTKLKLDNPFPSGRTLLHFGGAGQRTSVFAGNELVGRNVGGYNEFVFDITDAKRDPDGSIRLSILCDNSRDLETIPSDISDFTLYGGIYRHLRLIYVPAVSIELVHVRSEVPKGQSARCHVDARLHNPSSIQENLSIEISVTDPTGATVHHTRQTRPPLIDKQELLSFTVDRPQLWSPSTPALYVCTVTLESSAGRQEFRQRFGLRSVGFEDRGPFLLNGERLFLRGTQRHEDHAGYAAAVPDAITRQEMTMIRDMGANFIRLAHYPQAELVLDLCDELGLVVWEELPWCRAGVGDEAMRANARDLLRIMIEQHYNHPSIAFWSLGNEEDWPGMYPGDGKLTVPQFMQKLQDEAHRLDPSRMTSFRRCATATQVPDVYSPSIWAGWYNHNYQDYEKMLEENRDKVRHLLHMEWGADCHARRHAEEPYGEPNAPFVIGASPKMDDVKLPIAKFGDWSETYACDLFDWYLKTQETLPWFAGSAQWIFKDFSTPGRPENPIPRVNQKGLTERDLTKKEGYFVFQSYWAEKPMVHVYGHSWPVRWGRADQQRLVRVYSNCETVELFLNGKSCGTKKRNFQDFPCAGLRWALQFDPGQNALRAVGKHGATEVDDEIRFIYQTAAWTTPARLQLRVKDRSAERVLIEATLTDAQAGLCLDARNRVQFAIAGAGRLEDNLGTATGSRVIELYNGRAEIAMMPGAQPSVVSVRAQGIPEAFLRIE